MKIYTVIIPAVLILLLMMVATGIVSLLAWMTESPNSQKNGFDRKFVDYPVASLISVIKKSEEVTAACGLSKQHVYFRTDKPNKLWKTDRSLQNPQPVFLHFTPDKKVASAFDCQVDSPLVYIFAGNGPAIVISNLNNYNDNSIYYFNNAAYTRSVAVSPRSFVFCGFDPTVKPQRDQVFMKGDFAKGIYQRNDTLLEKNGDGGIQTDGLLSFDKKLGMLSYVYFYCNRFMCLDTNLNLVYTARTIDTFSTYQVKSGSISSGKKIAAYTSTAPPRVVNLESCVNNGMLFVNSRLKADNEPDKSFGRNAVIDVYRLKDGAYRGSFYIPDHRGEKLKRYRIFEDLVVVTYNKYIATYRLPAIPG